MKRKSVFLCLILFSIFVTTSCEDIGIKVNDRLSASPDPVYYSYGGGSCPAVLDFYFYWPPKSYDYRDHFIDIPEVVLRYDLTYSGGEKATGAYVTMTPPTSLGSLTDPSSLESMPYTASLNMSELSSDLKFGGRELKLDYSIKGTGSFIVHDASLGKDVPTRLHILYTDDKSVNVYPCIPTVPYTLEPGQYTLTPSLSPVPSSTATRQPKKPKVKTAVPPPPSCSVDPNNPSCVP